MGKHGVNDRVLVDRKILADMSRYINATNLKFAGT